MNTEKTIRTTRIMVAEQMFELCDIKPNMDILEPSAGSGNLADCIFNRYDIKSDCIELNKELRNDLISKGYHVVGEDFLKFNTGKRYDYIIACPTYKDNIDVVHIMHMYNFLKDGGCIVSLTSPFWTIKNNENQVKFRQWLEDKNYSLKMLKDNSFVEDFKTQPSMIIKIKKHFIA
jgi:hypothetical protein